MNFSRPNPQIDTNLTAMCIHNTMKSKIYLVSALKQFYPRTNEPFPKIEIPANKVMRVEHMYWNIHTRDGCKAEVNILSMNDALNLYPKSMWLKPDSVAGDKFSNKRLV